MPHTPRHVKNDSVLGQVGRAGETAVNTIAGIKQGAARSENKVGGGIRGFFQNLQDTHTTSANVLRDKVANQYQDEIGFYKQEIADGNGGQAVQGLALLAVRASNDLKVPVKELYPVFGELTEMNRLVTAGEGQQRASSGNREGAINTAAAQGFATGASPAGIGQTLNNAEQTRNAGRLLDMKEQAAPGEMALTGERANLAKASADFQNRRSGEAGSTNNFFNQELAGKRLDNTVVRRVLDEGEARLAAIWPSDMVKEAMSTDKSSHEQKIQQSQAVEDEVNRQLQSTGQTYRLDQTGRHLGFQSGGLGAERANRRGGSPTPPPQPTPGPQSGGMDIDPALLQLFAPLVNTIKQEGGTIEERDFVENTKAILQQDPNFDPNTINERVLEAEALFEAAGIQIIPAAPVQQQAPAPTTPTLSVATPSPSPRAKRTIQSFLPGTGGGRPQVSASPGVILPGR